MTVRIPRKRALPANPKHAETARLMRDLREALGISQIAYAELLDMSQSIISKLEAGHLPPSLKAFLRAYRAARGLGDMGGIAIEFENFMVSGKL